MFFDSEHRVTVWVRLKALAALMSALGQKRTFGPQKVMSA
jgi:hypothetical protein